MTDPNHVLASIDGALDDWDATMPDAMRWTPETPPEDRWAADSREQDGYREQFDLAGWLQAAGQVHHPPPMHPNVARRVAPAFRGERPIRLIMDEAAVRASVTASVAEAFDVPLDVLVPSLNIEQVSVGFRRFADTLTATIEPVRKALTAFGEAARAAGIIPEPVPDDARERALWLAQHRSTGPQQTPFARRGR